VTEPGTCSEQGHVSEEAFWGINELDNGSGVRQFMEVKEKRSSRYHKVKTMGI
jgi:hypothetical protein